MNEPFGVATKKPSVSEVDALDAVVVRELVALVRAAERPPATHNVVAFASFSEELVLRCAPCGWEWFPPDDDPVPLATLVAIADAHTSGDGPEAAS